MQKTIVLSLGGSLIVPDKIDINFLKDFKKIIEKHIKNGYKFVIYCGGGRLARDIQQAASRTTKLGNEDLDWLGIYATRLNGLLMRYIFGNDAQDPIIVNPNDKITLKKNIVIAAGWKPGRSTDYDAVLVAKNLGIREIVNMSNIDYVYNKDPKKHRDARKIEKISWKGYNKIISQKWKPGMNVPFDPVAAKEAQKSKLRVCIIGKDLKNFGDLLEGKKFRGTTIE